MEIKPDKKLLTKIWFVLLTISFFSVILPGILIQIFVPMGGDVTSEELSLVLWPIVLGVIAIIWIIGIPLSILWVKNLSYEIAAERITIHKGILTKIKQNIPYRAITDFMLHRSLYDRFLGIASIKVQTAGQSQSPVGYEGKLAGLTNWDSLLETLRGKVKVLYPASVNDSNAQFEYKVPGDTDKTDLIIAELKAIREILERK